MSKYTTEVRFICENSAGLKESEGANNVDNILDRCWDKVFNFEFPIFDENYRKVLCKKILKHYYTREIAHETVGRWKLALNIKLNEIMPYYNQLYKSELLEFNPFYDVDLTRTRDGSGTRDTTGSSKNTSTENGSNTKIDTVTSKETSSDTSDSTENNTSKTSESNKNKTTENNTSDTTKTDTNTTTESANDNTVTNDNTLNRFSDTPQNSMDTQSITDNVPLTTVTKINEDITTDSTKNSTIKGAGSSTNNTTENRTVDTTKSSTIDNTEKKTGKIKNSGSIDKTITDTINGNDTRERNGINTSTENVNSTDKYIEKVIGKQGTENYSSLLMKFRETFLNIDMMIIEDCSDCFFTLW